MIPPELEAQILRLYHVERWRVGTIALQLGVHHATVSRVIARDGLPKPERSRPSRVDAYVPFIQETLTKYPRLVGTRLYAMCYERGYRSNIDHFRALIRTYRPKPPAEAYLRLRTLPGEQGQVDWGHFGHLTYGRAKRPVVAFVMVLSYSRAIALRFFPSQQAEWFLRGHQHAFERLAGVPRVILYDNLKSAVLERRGDAIRFNPLLLAFAKHYRYEPRPVAVARGNEKGRVERAIRYIREAFFAARRFRDLDDLNRQADAWCEGIAIDRPWPEDRTTTVRKAWAQEQPALLTTPDNPFPTDERREVTVGKTPYVRFDGNDYSLPHTLVRTTVVVLASPDVVRILAGDREVARHQRSFSRGEQIEDPTHIATLVAVKRQGRQHRGFDRLAAAAPSSSALFRELAQRGHNIGNATQRLLQLLDLYGAVALERAIVEAMAKGVPHPHAVRHVLEHERYARGELPPLAVTLPDSARLRDLVVRPHPLSTYDTIGERPACAPPPDDSEETGREQEDQRR